MSEKYYLIWEVRHNTKDAIFHRLIKESNLKDALTQIQKIAIGEVRYVEVDDNNPVFDVAKLTQDTDRMYI